MKEKYIVERLKVMITEEVIRKIEKAFGFPLYEWQKEYLLNGRLTPKERGNGKTFAYILGLLLYDGEPIKVTRNKSIYDCELPKWHDGGRLRSFNYEKWFFHECLRINKILVENGIKTRIVYF